jgi:hypothetical protein
MLKTKEQKHKSIIENIVSNALFHHYGQTPEGLIAEVTEILIRGLKSEHKYQAPWIFPVLPFNKVNETIRDHFAVDPSKRSKLPFSGKAAAMIFNGLSRRKKIKWIKET